MIYSFNKLVLSLFSLWTISGCVTAIDGHSSEIDEINLSDCLADPELIVTSEGNVNRSNLKIRYCYHTPSGADLVVIIVEVHNQKYFYYYPNPRGSKVFSEYRFRGNGDLLLMSYGFESPDNDGNFFDYLLYEVGIRGPIKSGKSENRPRLLDIM